MLSFVIAEEDLQIETSYPFNEVTAVLCSIIPVIIIPHTAMNPYHIIHRHDTNNELTTKNLTVDNTQ